MQRVLCQHEEQTDSIRSGSAAVVFAAPAQQDVALPEGSVSLALGSFPPCLHTHMQIQSVLSSVSTSWF